MTSSTTSSATTEAMSDARPTTENTFKELPRWTPWAVFALVIGTAVVLTVRHGLGAALIVLAGSSLVLCIWLAFRAVQTVTEPDDLSLLVELPPTPAQARKQTALRALKDLDFEKAIGNLNEADYSDLERRYREEAKRAMREVDEERAELRERAEKLASQALVEEPEETEEEEEAPPPKKKKAVVKEPSPDPTPTPAAAPASIRAREKTATCPECETKNEPDARFCKQCGAKMEVSS